MTMAVKKSDIVNAVAEILGEHADQDLSEEQIGFLAAAVGEKLVDEVDGVYDDHDDREVDDSDEFDDNYTRD